MKYLITASYENIREQFRHAIVPVAEKFSNVEKVELQQFNKYAKVYYKDKDGFRVMKVAKALSILQSGGVNYNSGLQIVEKEQGKRNYLMQIESNVRAVYAEKTPFYVSCMQGTDYELLDYLNASVLTIRDEKGNLHGRALVWNIDEIYCSETDTTIENIRFLDCVYVRGNNLLKHFVNYLKTENIYHGVDLLKPVMPSVVRNSHTNEQFKDDYLSVTLKESVFEILEKHHDLEFPFLDRFSHFSDARTLTVSSRYNTCVNGSSGLKEAVESSYFDSETII